MRFHPAPSLGRREKCRRNDRFADCSEVVGAGVEPTARRFIADIGVVPGCSGIDWDDRRGIGWGKIIKCRCQVEGFEEVVC